MSKNKVSSKTLKQQKRHRRQWVTFLRMCRYGVNNFTRNAWLTVAATAIMTITLFTVFLSLVAHNIVNDTVGNLRDSVSMSIYLKTETTPEVAEEIADEVRALSSVKAVSIKTPDDARNEFIRDSKNDPDTLDATKEAKNKFFWTISIKVQDINDTSQLATLVADNPLVKENVDPNHEPSFAGTRRESIQKIASAGDFAQKIGIVASVVFASISMLIIFNTIRMAIFNRREEIQMMKLIGAERSFIRGPFLVEAIVYGFFAAIIATALGVTLLMFAAPSLEASGLSATGTAQMVTYYAGFVLIGMIILGAIIGIVSSLLATRRYLKL